MSAGTTMLIVFLILIAAFILTLIWMRENINFYRDLYKVEKKENDRLRRYGHDQEIKISEEEKARLKAVIRAAVNSKKAALGEDCESESEPEAEDEEEEGQNRPEYSYGEYTALVRTGKIKSQYRGKRDFDLPVV